VRAGGVGGLSQRIVLPYVSGVAATFVTDGIGESNSSMPPPPTPAWLLRIDNVTLSVRSGNLTVYLPPGSYAFTVTPPAGYVALSPAGDVAVSTAPTQIVTEFSPASSVFLAGFNETGLPIGTPWSVTIAGFTVPRRSSSIALSITDGENYSFRIGAPPDYSAAPSEGLFTAASQNLVVSVAFSTPVVSPASLSFPDGALLLIGAVVGTLLAFVIAARERKRPFLRRRKGPARS